MMVCLRIKTDFSRRAISRFRLMILARVTVLRALKVRRKVCVL